MKDCDLKRSWIGGEGLSSRELGQRKRQSKSATKGLAYRGQCRYSSTSCVVSTGFSVIVALYHSVVRVSR
jgi:hypothetical protein